MADQTNSTATSFVAQAVSHPGASNRLGVKLAGESISYGTAQEHLHNAAGARLHISGLKAAEKLKAAKRREFHRALGNFRRKV